MKYLLAWSYTILLYLFMTIRLYSNNLEIIGLLLAKNDIELNGRCNNKASHHHTYKCNLMPRLSIVKIILLLCISISFNMAKNNGARNIIITLLSVFQVVIFYMLHFPFKIFPKVIWKSNVYMSLLSTNTQTSCFINEDNLGLYCSYIISHSSFVPQIFVVCSVSISRKHDNVKFTK